MKRFKTYGTDDGAMPGGIFKPDDFSNDRYDGICIFANSKGEPVVVTRSKKVDPPRWRVATGNSTVYFTTYKEVITHCKNRGYTQITGGTQG